MRPSDTTSEKMSGPPTKKALKPKVPGLHVIRNVPRRGASIFFHPDCNCRLRNFTESAAGRGPAGRGLYHRWGLSPRPETPPNLSPSGMKVKRKLTKNLSLTARPSQQPEFVAASMLRPASRHREPSGRDPRPREPADLRWHGCRHPQASKRRQHRG